MDLLKKILTAEYEAEVSVGNRHITAYANLEWPGQWEDEQWSDLPDEIEIVSDPTFDIICFIDENDNEVEVPFEVIQRAKEIFQNLYWSETLG